VAAAVALLKIEGPDGSAHARQAFSLLLKASRGWNTVSVRRTPSSI